MPSRAEGLRPPPVWFFFVASICFGPQGPTRLIVFAGATVASPLGSHTHGFFPRSLFSFFLFLLCLSLSRMTLLEENKIIDALPNPPVAVITCMQGEMLCVFLRWFFGNSAETGRDRRGRQKNLVFPGISCDFVVGNLVFLLLFCFDFTCTFVVFFPRKTRFLPTLSFWGGFRGQLLEDYG